MVHSSKKAIVVGLVKSGQAAVRLLKPKGANVVGTDSAPLERLEPSARELGIEIRAGGHEGVRFDKVDLVVVSPGVPNFGALDRAAEAGVDVIGELELACRYIDAPLVAIGGTNGQSTTTTLVGALAKA
jgi:UDP-N-acetylmuramoylalanine--D-glutamate ligase